MDYTFLANLQTEFTLPEKGILSRVLKKDEHVNITLFGFSAGEALSSTTALYTHRVNAAQMAAQAKFLDAIKVKAAVA